MAYTILDNRGKPFEIEKKELNTPYFPDVNNTTFNQFTQLSWGKNSSSFANFDKNLSFLNWTSWMYIFSSQNADKMASAKLGLYYPTNEEFSTKRARKALNLNEKLKKKALETGQDWLLITDSDNPIIKILKQPNQVQTSYKFFRKVYLFLQLGGAAPIYKTRDEKGNWVGMEVLDPRRIRPFRVYNECKYDYFQYYGGDLNQNWSSVKTMRINPEDMIYINLDSMVSMIDGYSPAQAAWADIMLSNEKVNADIAYNKNRMRPDFLLMVKGADSHDLRRVLAEVENKLKGTSSVGNGIAFNSEQFQFQPLQNFNEYSVGDSEAAIRKLCSYFNYPYAKISNDQANVASAETMMDEWTRGLMPWMGYVSESLENAFREEFTELDQEAELEYENLCIGDKQYDLKKYTTLWTTGAIDRYTYLTAMGQIATPEDKGVYYKGQNINQNKEEVLNG